MFNLLLALALFSHALYLCWKLKKDLHILQLNSYRNERYFRWISKHLKIAFKIQDLLPVFAIIPLFFNANYLALFVWIGAYLLLFFLRSKKREKKPLVFTSRVKRLYAVNVGILLIFYLMTYMLPTKIIFSLTVLILIAFFSSLLMMISNFLIAPVESLLHRLYFNDAKKIIRSLPRLLVIGITGSFGKTTTKFILAKLLMLKYNTLMTPASFNTPMGISKTIRSELKPTHDVFVVEMSAKQKGDIKELCGLASPKIGILTAIGEQHLETFKSLENIKRTKNELIESLPEDGVAFFNMDNPHVRELSKLTNKKSIYYGIESRDVHYYVNDIEVDSSGCRFKICKSDGTSVQFQTKLLGMHYIYNILSAVSVACELGVDLQKMVRVIKQLEPVSHRLELKHMPGGWIYLDDAFNSNPVGSRMAIEVLQKIDGNKKVIVTPGMIELGDQEYRCNKTFGEQIAGVCDHVILVGKKQTLPIQEGLKEQRYPENKVFVAENFNEAYKHLLSLVGAGDVVLFENDLPDDYDEK